MTIELYTPYPLPEELKPFFDEVIPELKKQYPELSISETFISNSLKNHANPCGMFGYYGCDFWVGPAGKMESKQYAWLKKYAGDSLPRIDPQATYQDIVSMIEDVTQ